MAMAMASKKRVIDADDHKTDESSQKVMKRQKSWA
jgi:hypothetical protein